MADHGRRHRALPRNVRRIASASFLVASGLLTAPAMPVALAQTVERGDRPDTTTPADPAAALSVRRDNTRLELDALSKTIRLSEQRAAALQVEIDTIEKTNNGLRAALVESAGKRQALERQIAEGEAKLDDLRVREDTVHQSLKARRGVLAEVLAALQRMGRNPPPALLVTPEDALGSVRSAILLGAVVPGIRHETENLAANLQALARLHTDIVAQKTTLGNDMTSRLEEERRMNMLMAEKEKLKGRNASDLAAERRKVEQLASQATSLQGLIGSLETEIGSVRAAAEAARAEEEARARLSQAERDAAKELARTAVPDKNRIAPAYAFSDLQRKLSFPVGGAILRRYGEDDGTGHASQGIMLRAEAGALVTAPADGWIMFAGAFRSYGQMIILNPGDGYLVVMSGMESVSVQPGQFVVAGEPLGMMGEKRVASAAALALETDRPTLYIEFRKDGKPVDSQPWWTASDTGKVRNDS